MGAQSLDLESIGGGHCQAAGLVLYKSVKLPSKTFGELAQAALGIAQISAQHLHPLHNAGPCH